MCFVFIWVRSTLPRLRSDQLMQFAWLILIPVTLVNILLMGGIYLVVSSLGAPNWLFFVVTGVINWAGLFGFVQLVRRVTASSTRRAQAPAIRAQRRAEATAALALPLRDAIPARVAVAQNASPTNATGSTEV